MINQSSWKALVCSYFTKEMIFAYSSFERVRTALLFSYLPQQLLLLNVGQRRLILLIDSSPKEKYQFTHIISLKALTRFYMVNQHALFHCPNCALKKIKEVY